MTPGRRHHRDDFLHAGHERGHGIHDHRRRVGRLPAGHVQADPVERRHLHRDETAVGLGQTEAGLALVIVVGAHPVHGTAERRPQRRIDPLEGRVPEVGVERPGRGLEVDPVEPPRVLAHRGIAPGEHVFEDGVHRVAGGRIARGAAREEWIERIEGGNRQTANHREPSR